LGREGEKMVDITMEQKNLLEPFGKIFAGMDQQVLAMSDEDLQEMLKACYATSVINCWCCSFEAAQHLQRRIRREQHQRKQHAHRQAELAINAEER
jgi:hypothetical protein